jgi:hypothetical protein
MRRIVTLFCWIVLFGCCASTATAALLRYEPFDYDAVGTTVEGKTNPDGETWVAAYASTAPNAINVASGNLSVPPEMNPSIGNSAEIDGSGNGAGKAIRLPLGETIAPDNTVYYSFALRVDALTGSNITTGGFFIGLNNSAGATATNPGSVAARIQARIDPTDGTKYNLGIFNNRNALAASASWASAQLNVSDTYFVVASSEMNAGASNDVARLWINPVLNGTEPAPTAIDLTFATTDINVASIILRQGPAPHLTLDDLRFGTTWQSVIPEPASLWLLLIGCVFVFSRRRMR